MGTSLDTLSIYESMANLSEQMLDAARNADWGLLSALELRSANFVKLLKQNGADTAPGDDAGDDDNALRERKIALIKKILADDRDIRDLTEPWVKHLSDLIQNTSNERKLVRAYGVNQES
ncbi:MAG: flagellar synthesis protein [Herbaspirillum sp.]|jgi:flagellar protein FliT|nr:flagellar synthesis protein [Herbaspirillum sp.]